MFHDLAVVNFRSYTMTQMQRAWRKSNSALQAESCARQVWVGTKDEIANFPQNGSEEIYEGADAYAFLLRVACGLDSPNRGETNVKAEIFGNWNRAKQRAVHTRNLNTVFQNLIADSRIVHKYFLSKVRVNHTGIVARDLSEFQKGDKAFVVGHVNAYGSVTNYIDRLLRVLNNRNRRASLVYLTNPNQEFVEGILAKALLMRVNGIINYDVTSVPFNAMPVMVETCERVFCDLPMGDDLEADEYMRSVWANRSKRSGTMSHLRAGYGDDCQMPEVWVDADLDNFISPKDISEEADKREVQNSFLFDRAEKAITPITEARQLGAEVSASRFREIAPHLVAA